MSHVPAAAPSAVPVRVLLPADPDEMAIGGIATFVRGFVKHAPPEFELSMVGISGSRPLWRWHETELEGRPLRFLPVVHHRGSARARVPLAARFVAALAMRGRDLGRDVVASFHRPMTDLPLRRLGPMWRVVHLGVSDLTTAGSESRWARLARGLAGSEARSFRRMDRIYVVNRQVADEYRARFPEVAERIAFLPNWVDPDVFRPPAGGSVVARRGEIAAARGLDPSAPILLYAGRLEGQKDPILLARAFAALSQRRPGARLLVAGSGGLEAVMRRELAGLGVAEATSFLGTVARTEVAALMQVADALLITSAFETGPTVGLEALACGLPVVTTDVGEVAGVVRRSGAGEVVERREPMALAAAAEAVLNRPREASREAAVAAAAPYLAERVLSGLYDDNRELAARLRR
jgi:glycosyltransferase involved in cell wall biosynthesis